MSDAQSPTKPVKTPSTDRVESVLPEPTEGAPATETGGRESGPDPTRYGDWEKNGRCIDF